MIGQLAGKVVVISLHIDEPMSAKIENNDLFLPFQLRLSGLPDDLRDRVRRLRSRYDTLATGKLNACLETFLLL